MLLYNERDYHDFQMKRNVFQTFGAKHVSPVSMMFVFHIPNNVSLCLFPSYSIFICWQPAGSLRGQVSDVI